MSEIANALKKIRTSDKKVVFSAGYFAKHSSLSIRNIYILSTLIAVLLIGLYYFFNFLSFDKMFNKKLDINSSEIEQIYNKKISDYKNMGKKDIEGVLIETLIKGDNLKFDDVLKGNSVSSELILKYRGIYKYIHNEDLEFAKKSFEEYLKIKPDDISVISFLAGLYLTKGDLKKAYDLMSNVQDSNPNIIINKAIILEKMGEYSKALELYYKSLPMITNSIIKFKIKVKIESLKMILKGN